MSTPRKRSRMFARFAATDSLVIKALITKIAARRFYRSVFCDPSQSPFSGAMTLSFDCDRWLDIMALPDVFKILDNAGVKGSFCCVGKLIEMFPRQHKEIVLRGHEITNHTYSHPFSEELNPHTRYERLTKDQQRSEILKCHDTCREFLNYEPVGFRVPHFAVQSMVKTYEILAKAGYTYSSSSLAVSSPSKGQPYEEEYGIVEFPLSVCPVHPFQAFDTYHAFRSGLTKHSSRMHFLKTLDELVEFAHKTGEYVNLYFDPQDITEFPELSVALERIKKKMDILNYVELVERWPDKETEKNQRISS